MTKFVFFSNFKIIFLWKKENGGKDQPQKRIKEQNM